MVLGCIDTIFSKVLTFDDYYDKTFLTKHFYDRRHDYLLFVSETQLPLCTGVQWN